MRNVIPALVILTLPLSAAAFAQASADGQVTRIDESASETTITRGPTLPRALKVVEKTNFDMWTWSSRVFPGIDFLVSPRKGDRARIRMGNLTMTSHPIHLHG